MSIALLLVDWEKKAFASTLSIKWQICKVTLTIEKLMDFAINEFNLKFFILLHVSNNSAF